MRYTLLFLLVSIFSGLSCQTAEERRAAITPLPETTEPQPYRDLIDRARTQTSFAFSSLALDKWSDLADSASGLEQTSRFLSKSTEIPDKVKDSFPARVAELGKEASNLKEAIAVKDAKKTNEVIAKLNILIREMYVP